LQTTPFARVSYGPQMPFVQFYGAKYFFFSNRRSILENSFFATPFRKHCPIPLLFEILEERQLTHKFTDFFASIFAENGQVNAKPGFRFI
jgi:hypothetical protein